MRRETRVRPLGGSIGNGEFARVFPAANLRAAVTPALNVCGDHW